MTNKKTIGFIIIGIIVLAGVFYGGISYGKSQTVTAGVNGFSLNRVAGQFGMDGRNNRMNGGGFVGGQIISKDDKSITVKIMNNDPTAVNTNTSGSKIIFLSAETTVAKTITGSANDLITGTQVSVTGTANPDGSITAKSIQIRPK